MLAIRGVHPVLVNNGSLTVSITVSITVFLVKTVISDRKRVGFLGKYDISRKSRIFLGKVGYFSENSVISRKTVLFLRFSQNCEIPAVWPTPFKCFGGFPHPLIPCFRCFIRVFGVEIPQYSSLFGDLS